MLKKCKRGFSLVELIVTVLIMSSVIGISYNMIFLSFEAHDVTTEEYELQSAMRIASENTNNVLRYSSAIFTVAEGRFFESNLTDGWNYFGVTADGSEIVEYIYEERSGVLDHYKNVLVEAQDGITYDITFEVNPDNEKLIKYEIVGTSDNSSVDKIVIDSEIEALNSLQVVDRGTASTAAVAIAYRSDDRPTNQIVGTITMVLDVSGSMGYRLDPSDSTTSIRIAEMRTALADMINTLSEEELIELSIVPFSTSANYPSPTSESSSEDHPFYTLSDGTEKTTLLTKVSGLTANGGTNTGDGMRRAYYRNMYMKNNITTLADYGSDYTTSHYMIILVDGITTFATSDGTGTGDDKYKVDDGYQDNLTIYYSNSDNEGIIGPGSSESTYTDRYVELIGDKIKAEGITVYVIGFSKVASELNSVNKIATAAGANLDLTDPDNDAVYPFTDDLDLSQVFGDITDDILMDLWHVRGPDY